MGPRWAWRPGWGWTRPSRAGCDKYLDSDSCIRTGFPANTIIMTPKLDLALLEQALDICASFNLRKATRAVTQLFDDALQPVGIRVTQFVMLVCTAVLKDPPINQLAETMVTDRTTLTRNLKPLIKRGFIRLRTGQDRRQRIAVLTPKGKTIILKAVPYWDKAQKKVQEAFQDRWNGFLKDLALTVKISKKN